MSVGQIREVDSKKVTMTRRKNKIRWMFLLPLTAAYLWGQCLAFSVAPDHHDGDHTRRDLLLKAPLGAVFAYAYGRLFLNTLSNVGIRHPLEHESRVQSTIARTLAEASVVVNAAATVKNSPGDNQEQKSTLRILEVGIGTDCRIIRRGLYKAGLQAAKDKGIDKIELVGVDLQAPGPNVVQLARDMLDKESNILPVDLQILQQSVMSPLPFSDGYFDAIICCLTLCSVDEPSLAVQEMNRLLRPSGGTLGYVEHVAVNPDESYSFLEQQQVFLDPWQQRLADNCHLHRYTEQTIQAGFRDSTFLQEERFLVNAMWPVSMQCCGVLQKTA